MRLGPLHDPGVQPCAHLLSSRGHCLISCCLATSDVSFSGWNDIQGTVHGRRHCCIIRRKNGGVVFRVVVKMFRSTLFWCTCPLAPTVTVFMVRCGVSHVQIFNIYCVMTKWVSPWYIHNGWLGVKHQITYWLTTSISVDFDCIIASDGVRVFFSFRVVVKRFKSTLFLCACPLAPTVTVFTFRRQRMWFSTLTSVDFCLVSLAVGVN